MITLDCTPESAERELEMVRDFAPHAEPVRVDTVGIGLAVATRLEGMGIAVERFNSAERAAAPITAPTLRWDEIGRHGVKSGRAGAGAGTELFTIMWAASRPAASGAGQSTYTVSTFLPGLSRHTTVEGDLETAKSFAAGALLEWLRGLYV